MTDGADETAVRDPDETVAAGDTAVAGETATDSQPATRIRPFRPMPFSVDDYPTLVVVDPAHYTVTKEIARGGMGRIQLARDRRLGREVAVKESLVTSGSHVRRFEREVRITARLQHPSIVSVHEAGVWPSGEPFYAMRLVSGRSLDAVIQAARSHEAQLALLPHVLAVADAMAYAHGQRVIHRDLKPGNVVIGEFGETVVIDWGLAKELGGRDTGSGSGDDPSPSVDGPPASVPPAAEGETTVGDVLGTPAYMPPEQACGEPVDERADVYAIGAILYHVLAGRPPFVATSGPAAIAAVVEGPPPPLRELAPAAPGELVALVERAMARAPAARYPTARELAEDLRRFQTGQLVGAHRYSIGQLFRRWLRRHRTAVMAIGAAALVGIAIGVLSLSRVLAAERLAVSERSIAEGSRHDAEGIMQFMLGDLRLKLVNAGKLDLLDAVARRAAAYYDARRATGSDEDRYQSTLAQLTLAKVFRDRGDLPAARRELAGVRATLEALGMVHPEVRRYQHALVEAASRLGDIDDVQGDVVGALAALRGGLARAQQQLAEAPGDPDALHDVVTCHGQIADLEAKTGALDDAIAESRLELALASSYTARDDRVREDIARRDVLVAHARVGRLLASVKNDLAGALAEYRLALEIGEREAAKDKDGTYWLTDVVTSHAEVGEILALQLDDTGALAQYRAGEAIVERLTAIDPTNLDWADHRSGITEAIGMLLFDRHDLTGARTEYQRCAAIALDLVARDPSNTRWRRNLSVFENKLGDIQITLKDVPSALASYRAALASRELLVAKDPTNAEWRRDLFYSHYKVGIIVDNGLAHHRDALAEFEVALALAEQAAAKNPIDLSAQFDLAVAHRAVGDVDGELHDRASARREYHETLDIARRAAKAQPTDRSWKTMIELGEQALAKVQ